MKRKETISVETHEPFGQELRKIALFSVEHDFKPVGVMLPLTGMNVRMLVVVEKIDVLDEATEKVITSMVPVKTRRGTRLKKAAP